MIVKANEQKLHQWRHLVSPPRQGKSLAVGLSVRALAAWRTLPSSWQIRSCRLSRGLRDCVETKHKVCLNFVTVELLCLNREEPSMPLVLHPQRLENSWPLPRAEPVEQTRLHGFDEPRHSIYGAGQFPGQSVVGGQLPWRADRPARWQERRVGRVEDGTLRQGDFLWVRPELGEFGISVEARKGNGEVLVLLLGASSRGTYIRDIHDT